MQHIFYKQKKGNEKTFLILRHEDIIIKAL